MEKTFAKRYWPTIVGAIVGAIAPTIGGMSAVARILVQLPHLH